MRDGRLIIILIVTYNIRCIGAISFTLRARYTQIYFLGSIIFHVHAVCMRLSRNSFACFCTRVRKIGRAYYLPRNFDVYTDFPSQYFAYRLIRCLTMLIYYFETEQEFASRASCRQQGRSIIDRRFTFGADCRLHRGRLHLFPCLYNSPSFCLSFLSLSLSPVLCGMYVHTFSSLELLPSYYFPLQLIM